jgi:shikimate dehydrogenase
LQHYAVIGHPISHSRSPYIHGAFAAQFNQQIDYQRIDCESQNFAETVRRFFTDNRGGMSVTVPHKSAAFDLCEQRSQAAQAAGAVNTLYLDEQGRLCGDNTDGRGLLNDLMFNHHLSLKDRNVLIIGAGGATRGLIEPLIDAGVSSLSLANRTVERAREIAAQWAHRYPIAALGLQDHLAIVPDVVVHASSGGLVGEAVMGRAEWYLNRPIAVDISYGKSLTPFLTMARTLGARQLIDGLGMLVEQAALAFQIWRQQTPDTLPVIQALRAELDRPPE